MIAQPKINLGGWNIVYAGDVGFKYKGYTRSKNKKSCTLLSSENGPKQNWKFNEIWNKQQQIIIMMIIKIESFGKLK